MKKVINKIFAPISRWQFVFYVFLLYIFTNFLIAGFWSFIPDGFIQLSTYLIPVIGFYIVLKRFLDICEKPWKAVVCSFVVCGFIALIYSMSLYTFFNSPISKNIRNFMGILPIYIICRDILIIFPIFN